MTLGKTLEVAIWRLKVSASWQIIVDLSFNHRFPMETAILQVFWHSNQWMEKVCNQPAPFVFLFQCRYFNSPWKSSWNLRSRINQKAKLDLCEWRSAIDAMKLVSSDSSKINWTCTTSSVPNDNRAQWHGTS